MEPLVLFGVKVEMTRADTYRYYAAQCSVLARNLPEDLDRQYTIEMAVRWYELAHLSGSFGKEHDGQEPGSPGGLFSGTFRRQRDYRNRRRAPPPHSLAN
jgi:hypothetical protein